MQGSAAEAPRDLYAEVTNKIVEALEKGGVPPWVKPWTGTGGGLMPMNGVTKKPYRGVNVVVLLCGDYADCRWYTFQQSKEAGGSVRKGEKGTLCVFFKPSSGTFQAEVTNPDTGEKTQETRRRPPIMRHFYVWNHTQIAWSEDAETPATPVREPGFPLAVQMLESSGAVVGESRDRACYSPSADRILMPPMSSFTDEGSYWGTLLHELTHWTGHESRCKRSFSGRFGDAAYAFEELVAELGAAMLCAVAQVDGALQHEAYLASWLKVLKADKYAIFTAAREAQRAADFIVEKTSAAEGDDESQEELSA